MALNDAMFYVGFFLFFFVFGGIAGAAIFKGTENIFLISGFTVSIIGMFIGRLVMNLISKPY